MREQDLDLTQYKQYATGGVLTRWAKRHYQRKILDTYGTRYFINIYVSNDDTVVFKGQFRVPEGTLDFQLFGLTNTTQEQAEAFFARLWLRMGAHRYE